MYKSYRKSLKVQDSFLNLKRILLREFNSFSYDYLSRILLRFLFLESAWFSMEFLKRTLLWEFSWDSSIENSLRIIKRNFLWEFARDSQVRIFWVSQRIGSLRILVTISRDSQLRTKPGYKRKNRRDDQKIEKQHKWMVTWRNVNRIRESPKYII